MQMTVRIGLRLFTFAQSSILKTVYFDSKSFSVHNVREFLKKSVLSTKAFFYIDGEPPIRQKVQLKRSELLRSILSRLISINYFVVEWLKWQFLTTGHQYEHEPNIKVIGNMILIGRVQLAASVCHQ